MLDGLLAYWWIAIPMMGAAAFLAVRFWAQREFDAAIDDILVETQASFAEGDAEVHSIQAVRTIMVQDETAILYHIDATITPTHEGIAWCAADLFLRGVDGDPNQVGDVLTVKHWNGESFEPIKNKAPLEGTQRLLLSVRFAGSPDDVRFNFNFANFGQVIRLPEIEAEASSVGA